MERAGVQDSVSLSPMPDSEAEEMLAEINLVKTISEVNCQQVLFNVGNSEFSPELLRWIWKSRIMASDYMSRTETLNTKKVCEFRVEVEVDSYQLKVAKVCYSVYLVSYSCYQEILVLAKLGHSEGRELGRGCIFASPRNEDFCAGFEYRNRLCLWIHMNFYAISSKSARKIADAVGGFRSKVVKIRFFAVKCETSHGLFVCNPYMDLSTNPPTLLRVWANLSARSMVIYRYGAWLPDVDPKAAGKDKSAAAPNPTGTSVTPANLKGQASLDVLQTQEIFAPVEEWMTHCQLIGLDKFGTVVFHQSSYQIVALDPDLKQRAIFRFFTDPPHGLRERPMLLSWKGDVIANIKRATQKEPAKFARVKFSWRTDEEEH